MSSKELKILRYLLILTICFVLGTKHITMFTWQFYVLLIGLFSIRICEYNIQIKEDEESNADNSNWIMMKLEEIPNGTFFSIPNDKNFVKYLKLNFNDKNETYCYDMNTRSIHTFNSQLNVYIYKTLIQYSKFINENK